MGLVEEFVATGDSGALVLVEVVSSMMVKVVLMITAVVSKLCKHLQAIYVWRGRDNQDPQSLIGNNI